MRKKINLRLIGMSVVVAVVTMFCIAAVFYGLFLRQVKNDLKTSAEVISAVGIPEDGIEEVGALRVTWIAADGTVLYDNDTDAALLENHADRPEVAAALASGEGEVTRRSDTMGQNTVYYAVRMDDGSVLRLAEEVSSIFSVFVRTIPMMLLIVAAIIVVSAVIARFLTRQLLAPIDRMAHNIEDTAYTSIYKELVPFVNTIREQHDNILSAAKARQDFTANVSHELKTPLTAISGYAELIENHMVDGEQETRIAQEIRQNAEQLVSLINDIIRLSELDSGVSDELVLEEMDLWEVVESRADLLQVSAQKKKVTLFIEGEACPMRGNRHMIGELVDNLCQNAVHYNREGGQVHISVRTEEGRPVLIVADTGIGIPKDLQDRVFERFFRVDKGRSRETGGTGLGLAIVKHIVELHDAEITLESEIDAGTTIKVVF